MNDLFIAEGERELPVEDYVAWVRAQQQRQGEARRQWLTMLADAGWHMGSLYYRSMAYLRPDLLDEYDFDHDENPIRLPYEDTLTGTRSVWWRCMRDESHRWRTSVNNRHRAGTGCPRCNKKGVSRREHAVFTALRTLHPDLISPGSVPRNALPSGPRRQRSWRVDMLLPGRTPVVVEYDGAYWHRDIFPKDQEKSDDLMASGHTVIRIREVPLPLVTPNDVVCQQETPPETVAELVHKRISELTRRPRADDRPLPPGEQLDLFPSVHPTLCVG
ncbi:zinc-ribbon domain-containing protein [Streptomyces syringium]|uniref:zinc-ribbon domain-containing protein n=1 Tax=Streptomyces syringium TaxID=76729 RepID=UPI003420C5E0